jgi:hypothetical protein
MLLHPEILRALSGARADFDTPLPDHRAPAGAARGRKGARRTSASRPLSRATRRPAVARAATRR